MRKPKLKLNNHRRTSCIRNLIQTLCHVQINKMRLILNLCTQN